MEHYFPYKFGVTKATIKHTPDEYSSWRYVEAFEEHSTYSSAMFVEHLENAFPLPIECIQTDNEPAFTNRFTTSSDKPTLFKEHLKRHGIQHKLIRPYISRHNGNMERSHIKDNERFYATYSFYLFEDFAKQLKVYNTREYNNFPRFPLRRKSLRQVQTDYLRPSVTHVWQTYTNSNFFAHNQQKFIILPPLHNIVS